MKLLNNFEKVNILVAGDYMLDKYCHGEVSRLSPEAPVPVVQVQKQTYAMGGAANVVNNLCELGCSVRTFGVVGNDCEGKILHELLQTIGSDTKNLFHLDLYKTITKMRIIGNDTHQIARLDYNENEIDKFPKIEHLLYKIKNALEGCQIVIISDYGKGFCSETLTKALIDNCMKYHIPVIVDPKGTNWNRYRGATWITPNFNEFAAIVNKEISNNDKDISANIANIANDYDIDNVLVTRSEKGITFYDYEKVIHSRTKAKEVFDVSGAGDTVVSVLAAMLGAGSEKIDAVETANLAAGIVVAKRGTAPITKSELQSELRKNHLDHISAKIMSWNTLFAHVDMWKLEGKTIALANGCFDIFHKGHASLIQASTQCADKLIIAINADVTVRKLKGEGRPINKELDRAYVLASLEGVDAVVIFEQDTPEELLSRILPDVLVKGAEYTIEQVPGRQYAKRVELIDYIDGYSTTSIVNRFEISE